MLRKGKRRKEKRKGRREEKDDQSSRRSGKDGDPEHMTGSPFWKERRGDGGLFRLVLLRPLLV